jgi:hypothetical protein
MNAMWGWALAVLAVAVGWMQWGWRGVVLAVTVVVFWLLLQFSRALRVMRLAAGAPVGEVPSAVMLHARLRTGMRLMEILPLTRSLGQRVDAATDTDGADDAVPGKNIERFAWRDTSGACVQVVLTDGRLRSWTLRREPQTVLEPPAPTTAERPESPAADA